MRIAGRCRHGPIAGPTKDFDEQGDGAMQTCIVVLGILLAGQLNDSSGTRYPGEISPPLNDQQNDQQTWADQQPAISLPTMGQPAMGQPVEKNPLRSAAPAATLPAPPLSRPPQQQAPQAGLTKVTQAGELLRSLAKTVGREKLSGTPLLLAEAIQNARSRAEQTRRVNLYWELSRAVTDYHLASLEELELQSLRSGLTQAGQAWSAAQQAAATRKQIARSTAQVAQLRLSKALGAANKSHLPLPTDLPHCGAYETKYEKIFQGRTSREAQQLGELLSLRHDQLDLFAMNAAAAREWLLLVRQQLSPQDDNTQLLKAYEQLALHRQAFVASAYQYNANIARYTELAVPQKVGNVRLVAMLIQSKGNAVGNQQHGAVRQATAEEAMPQNHGSPNNTHRYKPKTFAEPDRNETRRVPSGKAKGQQSILVMPQGK